MEKWVMAGGLAGTKLRVSALAKSSPVTDRRRPPQTAAAQPTTFAQTAVISDATDTSEQTKVLKEKEKALNLSRKNVSITILFSGN